MTINEFYDWTNKRWRHYQRSELEVLYIMTCGLAGETGEVVELLKKHVRDHKLDLNALKLELGDVLHYWCRIASKFGMTPEAIMLANIEKLEDRDRHGKKEVTA